MKIRNGFVSNSSSASFIIYKDKLSEEELKELKQWYEDYVNEQIQIYPKEKYEWGQRIHSFKIMVFDKKSNCVCGYVNQFDFPPDTEQYPKLSVLIDNHRNLRDDFVTIIQYD